MLIYFINLAIFLLSILTLTSGLFVKMGLFVLQLFYFVFFNIQFSLSLTTALVLDPLEQFEILLIIKQVGLTNLAIIMLFIFLLAFSVLSSVATPVIKNVYAYFASVIYTLVKTIAKENLHLHRQQYFLMLFYLFITIFLSNLIGLIPYSFTPTSSFIMTFFLALGHFIGINFIALTQTR